MTTLKLNQRALILERREIRRLHERGLDLAVIEGPVMILSGPLHGRQQRQEAPFIGGGPSLSAADLAVVELIRSSKAPQQATFAKDAQARREQAMHRLGLLETQPPDTDEADLLEEMARRT
jgi:hypothetical protein